MQNTKAILTFDIICQINIFKLKTTGEIIREKREKKGLLLRQVAALLDIEYKSSWRDEYLKWICGFANANGGSIFIGKDDAGNIVGVTDAKKLLEEIPNKVRDTLGIFVDVNLHTTAQGDFIEIIV